MEEFSVIHFIEIMEEFSCRPVSAAPSSIQSMIAKLCEVPVEELMGRGGSARVKFARQTAMYLMHVVCCMSLTEIAELFGRTRSAASDACHRIEDLRDNPRFDQCLTQLEDLLRTSAEMGVAP